MNKSGTESVSNRQIGTKVCAKIRAIKKTVEERFWEKVGPHDDPNACWLWRAGYITSCGLQYGTFTVGDKKVRAHRFSYELH